MQTFKVLTVVSNQPREVVQEASTPGVAARRVIDRLAPRLKVGEDFSIRVTRIG